MKLFSKTLTQYLQQICHSTLLGHSENKELRIFIASIPPETIYELGSKLTDYFKDSKKNIKFIYKTGYPLLCEWQASGQAQNNTIKQIIENKWIDDQNRLTHYRNLQLSDYPGHDYLIVMLIGVEKATDSSSLKDFFILDTESVWKNQMKKSFMPWIEEILTQYNIPSENSQREKIDELLKTLFSFCVEDLLQIASFLESLDFKTAQDGKDAIRVITENLDFWGLPQLKDIPARKKDSDYIKAGISFFNYEKYLKEYEKNKALKKIEAFREKYKEGSIVPDYSGEFSDIEDLLECLETYIQKNRKEDRDRLLKTNFVFIKDKILDLKIGPGKNGSKTKPKPPHKIDAPPLETILKAIWLTMEEFIKKYDSPPVSLINAIRIEAIKFRHDFEEKESINARDLIRGCLGGIDEFIEKYLKIGTDNDGVSIEIALTSCLCPMDEDDKPVLEKSGASVPGFQFRVIFETDMEEDFDKDFQWQLPATQPYRILWNLTCAVNEIMKQEKEQCLPIFHIPTYNEIFMASDEEEASRVLKLGINDLSLSNLLTAPGLQTKDPLYSNLKDMAHEFGRYIEHKTEHGYFSAIEEPRAKLYDKTIKAMEAYVKNPEIYSKTQLAPLLYKAFLVLHNPEDSSGFSYWDSFMESAVVMGLHPAMLEMLRHQHTFLIASFGEKFNKALTCSGGMRITERMWDDAIDFAAIHYPLFGLLVNQNKELDTRVKSMGLLHLIGEPRPAGSTLSAKVLLRNDNSEEEGLSDSDLFKETRVSRIISRILKEYTQVHPHSHDGITIAVLNVADIQATIAGVDDFIRNLLKKQSEDYKDQELPPYHLSLILFMQGTDNQTVARYMQEWRKRWESVQESKKFEYYQRCRLSVSQRIVGKKDWQNDYLDIISKSDFEADVAVLPHFITAGKMGNEFKEIKPFKPDYHSLKYPFIEIPGCLEDNPSVINQRRRIISNRQFRIASLHSEIGVRLKQPAEPGKEHVVISQGDFRPWMEIMDRLHKKASWVLCIDSSIDEKLIAQTADSAGQKKREIIGFASGLGAHGELNYTISTERTSLKDIEIRIKRHLERLFTTWADEDYEKAASLLVRKSRSLSGLSLVRAAGPSESVRDLIGYTLIKMSLPKIEKDGMFLCDELISLDTFQHWFNNAENKERTDLLRITAYYLQPDHQIHISARLIECKLAKMSGSYLETARMQIENSLYHLMQCFHPRKKQNRRFDQRYWWAQLLRLIASKSMVSSSDQMAVSTALEDLADGYFAIEWQANAAAYWVDQPEDKYSIQTSWKYQYGDQELDIDAISCGNKLIHRLCCNQETILFPITDSAILLRAEGYENNALNVEKENQSETQINENSLKKEPEPFQEETDGTIVINVEEKKESIVSNEIPERIFLGTASPNREIFWEFGNKGLPNRHLLIFGKSGTGKTYAIQSILCELGFQKQNSLIVDYTNGFEEDQLEPETLAILKPEQHRIQLEPLPVNPFRKQKSIIGGQEYPEKSATAAQRVMSVFASVYGLGDQQKSVLYQVIKQGIETFDSGMTLQNLLELLLEHAESKGFLKDAAASLLSKIQPFVDGEPFGEEHPESWQNFYDDTVHRSHVVQMVGCGKEFARLATEFTLIDLYWFARGSGNQNQPKVVVLDEIQNLDHSQDGPIAGFLTEGRKFGISLILATQTLSNLHSEEKDRLFQASHKLFFKPAETEIKEYAKILEHTKGEKSDIWIERLAGLNKGECYSLGPSLNPSTGELEDKAFKIKITSLEDRIQRQEQND